MLLAIEPSGAVHEHAGGPADQAGPLQAPGQGQRAAQRPAGLGRARPGRHQARAEIAPTREERGHGGHDRGGRQRQHQHQPAIARVGPDLPRPAERGQPQQPSQAAGSLRPARRRARRHDHVGRDEHADRDRPGPAGAFRQLGRDRGDRGEQQPERPDREREGGRAADRQADDGQPGEDQHRQHAVGGHRERQAGGQRGVPAHGGRADQLEASRLLIGPGVPDHDEDAHQARGHRGGRADLVGGQRADRRAVQRAGQRERPRVVVDARGEGLP